MNTPVGNVAVVGSKHNPVSHRVLKSFSDRVVVKPSLSIKKDMPEKITPATTIIHMICFPEWSTVVVCFNTMISNFLLV